MNRFRRKLRSTTGASMLLGLLFLLFCLTVGAVVLTAASVSAGRTQRNRRVQQNYLAVQSAANLLVDDMKDMEFTDTYTHTEVTYHHYSINEDGTTSHWTTPGSPIDTLSPIYGGTKLGTKEQGEYLERVFLCQEAIKGYPCAQPPPAPDSITLAVQGGDASSGDSHALPDVTIDLTFGSGDNAGTEEGMESGYTITAQVYLTTPGPEGDHKITLELVPEVKHVGPQKRTYWNGSDEERDETVFTCEVTWKLSQVTKPEQEATP